MNSQKEVMEGRGVTIGKKTLASEGKWRCAVCTFSNLNGSVGCYKCKEPKQAMKEQPVRAQSFVKPPMQHQKNVQQ